MQVLFRVDASPVMGCGLLSQLLGLTSSCIRLHFTPFSKDLSELTVYYYRQLVQWRAVRNSERTQTLEFWPTWFNDIEDTLEAKLQALDIYALGMRAWPHPRSLRALEHLARWRGASVGMQAAEAFVLGRRLHSF